MNMALVGTAAVLLAGGLGGYVVYDQFTDSGPGGRCEDGPPAGEAAADGVFRFRIDNQGPDRTVVVCLHEDGSKISQRTLTVPARHVTYVDLAAPVGMVWGELDYGAGITGRTSQNLRLCPERTAMASMTLAEGDGIGVRSADCSSRDRDPEPLAMQEAGFISVENLSGPPMAPALAAGLGLAILAGLGVYFRARIHFAGLLLFSRLARNDVLDLEARQRIHQLVGAEPGIHANAIAERLELAQGQLLYHLHVLVRERLLTRLVNFGYRHYFVAGGYGIPQMRAMAALRMPGLRRLYEAVRASPGQDLGSVAAQVGLSAARVSRVARRLEAVGLLERRAAGRRVFLVPRPQPGVVA